MAFHSILFKEEPDYQQIKAAVMPRFFIDLNLDQVVQAITAGRDEYDLKPFFYFPLTDRETIRYRQAVSRDLEIEELLQGIRAFAKKMVIVRRYLGLVDQLYYRYNKEGWFLEAILVYCDAIEELDVIMSTIELRSSGFTTFREYLHEYVNSVDFQTLRAEALERKADQATIQYSIVIKGNRVGVRKYESEIDYSVEVERTFEKFKQGGVKDYRVKVTKSSGFNHVEAQILNCVARLYPEIFSALDNFCVNHPAFIDETIRIFDQEVQFYLAYVEYIRGMSQAGLPFCYPEVSSENKEIFVQRGFDIALAHKLVGQGAEIVCNDFNLEGKERIIVVSGPNQGGKTTFARMFGQMHYLAVLGLTIPGSHARLFLFDQLFTHFEKEENIKNLRGKLHEDLVRIYEILELATPGSIIIMNEIFTSTTLQDAVFLSKKVMERILSLDLLCVCVTFIDELSTLSEKTISMVSTVVPENPAQRTFKIIRQPSSGLAYAISIAEKYRLTYELLRERIKG